MHLSTAARKKARSIGRLKLPSEKLIIKERHRWAIEKGTEMSAASVGGMHVLSAAHWTLIVHFGRSNPCHVQTHKSFVRFECRAKRPDTTKLMSIMFMQHK